MNSTEVNKLTHGLYKIYWKEKGGHSVAAVGSLYNGDRWLAPTNWTSPTENGILTTEKWADVERVELIATQNDIPQLKQPSSEPILIPFDLEVALAHPERVRLRNGKSISEIYECKTIKDYNIVVAFDGGGYWVTKEGRHDRGDDNEYDLFLLAETKTMWVNVCDMRIEKDLDCEFLSKQRFFSTKEEAETAKSKDCIAVVPITFPVK